MSRAKILFQLSGSIACYKACSVISRLVQNDFEVEVVATKSALEFVGRATLEGLTGKPVHVEMFAAGQYMNHIDLIKWADLAILCPATANSISKLANGLGEDLVSTLFLAHNFKKPYLISPAMNVNMYDHPAMRASLARLASWGAQILPTEAGRLACGDTGEGRLLDPEAIYAHILQALEMKTGFQQQLRGQRILVTSGGTKEPLDGVRYLTNISTGRTGAKIANDLANAGADVTYLHAEGALVPEASSVHKLSFSSYVSLERALTDELGTKDYYAVVHAAAVGDFSIDSIETVSGSFQSSNLGKIDSSSGVQIKLKRNPKLLTSLKSWSRNKNLKVVAFKLTNSPNSPEGEASITKLANESSPDLIVQNDLSEISNAHHPFRIYSNELSKPRLLTKVDGATSLANYLSKVLSSEGHA